MKHLHYPDLNSSINMITDSHKENSTQTTDDGVADRSRMPSQTLERQVFRPITSNRRPPGQSIFSSIEQLAQSTASSPVLPTPPTAGSNSPYFLFATPPYTPFVANARSNFDVRSEGIPVPVLSSPPSPSYAGRWRDGGDEIVAGNGIVTSRKRHSSRSTTTIGDVNRVKVEAATDEDARRLSRQSRVCSTSFGTPPDTPDVPTPAKPAAKVVVAQEATPLPPTKITLSSDWLQVMLSLAY